MKQCVPNEQAVTVLDWQMPYLSVTPMDAPSVSECLVPPEKRKR